LVDAPDGRRGRRLCLGELRRGQRSIDSGCVPLLGQSLASEGTSTPLMFSGTYYDSTAKKVLQPPGLFSADASAQPVFYSAVGLGSHGPINPTCALQRSRSDATETQAISCRTSQRSMRA